MATRQRGSNNRASSSKQPGSVTPNSGSSAAMGAPPLTDPREQSAREQRIAISAYLRAAERGFTPGHEIEDWLAAERELEANGAIDLTSPQQ